MTIFEEVIYSRGAVVRASGQVGAPPAPRATRSSDDNSNEIDLERLQRWHDA
jgi:hypothetical protein